MCRGFGQLQKKCYIQCDFDATEILTRQLKFGDMTSHLQNYCAMSEQLGTDDVIYLISVRASLDHRKIGCTIILNGNYFQNCHRKIKMPMKLDSDWISG